MSYDTTWCVIKEMTNAKIMRANTAKRKLLLLKLFTSNKNLRK